MIIDYTNFDKNVAAAVRSIESKGHVRYIRYLLSKRVPPTSIRKELARLSLSAPFREAFLIYFTNVLIPLIEQYGLSKYYESYYKRLATGEHDKELSSTLSFEASFEDNHEDRIAFCGFIRELDIEDMWSKEIVRYYGGIHGIPQNAEGERIIKVVTPRNVENILTSPRKYVIDKLLLENIPAARIANYMWEKYQIKVSDGDIYTYSKYFFNFERRDIEILIEQLIAEKNSVSSDLEIIDNNEDLSLGDKAAITMQYENKIKFLNEIISELNAKYSDLTFRQAVDEKVNLETIVEDIIYRGYERFKLLDRARDRDVVKPITEISKMVFSAIDKKQQLEDHKIRAEKTALDRDKNAGEVLLELYQERYEDNIKTMETKHTGNEAEEISEEEIEGLEDV